MVIPEEREGRDEYNPLLSRDPTPANQQAYGAGASATIDHSDTRRGGLMPMTTISISRPKVEGPLTLASGRRSLPRWLWICVSFVVNCRRWFGNGASTSNRWHWKSVIIFLLPRSVWRERVFRIWSVLWTMVGSISKQRKWLDFTRNRCFSLNSIRNRAFILR